ncbi:hypothetical protein ES706_04429 [subsurface metagenome]
MTNRVPVASYLTQSLWILTKKKRITIVKACKLEVTPNIILNLVVRVKSVGGALERSSNVAVDGALFQFRNKEIVAAILSL